MRRGYGGWRRLYHLAVVAAAVSASAAGAAPAKLVLAFGDSLTAGYELPPGDGFAPQLEAALRAKGIAATVHNAGVSGDTTAQGRARLGWVLTGLKAKPDLAIVELGANDMLRGIDPTVTRGALAEIVERLKARGIPVLLTGMLAAPNYGPDYKARFDAIYPDLAGQYGLTLYPFFLDGIIGDRGQHLDDGLHPNAKGVETIAARILPTVEAFLDGLGREAEVKR